MAPRSELVYVWAWPPGRVGPVPCGALSWRDAGLWFAYGRSYLERADAISLYGIPLRTGWVPPASSSDPIPAPGAIRDAVPDAWGQRVVLNRLLSEHGREADFSRLSAETYLLESASDRFGAIDFQASPEVCMPRGTDAGLDDLLRAAEIVDTGGLLPDDLRAAALGGTSIGGARPKAMFRDGTQSWIAKFPTSDDPFNIVGAEAASLYLARLAGLDVPGSRVLRAVGKDVLLVERFDRTPEPGRIMAVSGLTLLGLGELEGRYGSYPELLGAIQDKAADPVGTGRELFSRIAFNIAVSNTDDHLRNHAALWDGKTLRLSPAFDLAPGVRHGETSYQAIPYGLNGERESRFAGLIRCAGAYGLSSAEAAAAVESLVDCIEANWADATDAARLSAADRALLWRNQILHPAASYGLVNAS